jgi:hypothetical protein
MRRCRQSSPPTDKLDAEASIDGLVTKHHEELAVAAGHVAEGRMIVAR